MGNKYYHGTSSSFDNPVNSTGEESNIFGEGLYTTSDKNIAMKYSKKGKGKTPAVLEVNPQTKVNAYDMHQNMTPEISNLLKNNFPEEAHEYIDNSSNMFDALNEIRSNSREMNIPKYEYADMVGTVSDSLMDKGYNALRHKGGVLTGGNPHNVTIFKNPEQDVKTNRIKQIEPATEEMGYSEPVTKYTNWNGEMGAATTEALVGTALPIAVHYANQATHGEFNPLDIKSAGEGSEVEANHEQPYGSVQELYRQKKLDSLKQ